MCTIAATDLNPAMAL